MGLKQLNLLKNLVISEYFCHIFIIKTGEKVTFEVFSQSTCYNLHRNICPHNLVTCQNDTCQIKLKPAQCMSAASNSDIEVLKKSQEIETSVPVLALVSLGSRHCLLNEQCYPIYISLPICTAQSELG